MSVLVVLTRPDQLRLVRWAALFAASSDEALDVVLVGRSEQDEALQWFDRGKATFPDQEPLRQVWGRRRELLDILDKRSLDLDADVPTSSAPVPDDSSGPPSGPLRIGHLNSRDPAGAVVRLCQQLNAQLLVLHKAEDVRGGSWRSRVAMRAFSRAPCDVLLMRLPPADSPLMRRRKEDARPSIEVVVLAEQGTAEREAWQRAHRLEQMTFDPPIDVQSVHLVTADLKPEDSAALDSPQVEASMQELGHPGDSRIAQQLVPDSIESVLGKSTDKDLVLIGASEHGLVTRTLMGDPASRLINARESPVDVGVFRPARPPAKRIWELLFQRVRDFVPRLQRADREAMGQRIADGSEPDRAFILRIVLATAIASLGLLQNSAAVVIGGMLVAPLMTPMVGTGLALVQGNLHLARRALIAVGLGFATALCVGLICGLVVQGLPIGAELLSRTQPTLLDLCVAFLSGAAGAFAYARTSSGGHEEVLPGVAVAAALVPPVATCGILLSRGLWTASFGASVLFSTNLVAIVFGAVLVFWLYGVRVKTHALKLWAKRLGQALGVAALALAVPLSIMLVQNFAPPQSQQEPLGTKLRRVMEQTVEDSDGHMLVRIEGSKGAGRTRVRVLVAEGPGAAAERAALKRRLRATLRTGDTLELVVLPATWDRSKTGDRGPRRKPRGSLSPARDGSGAPSRAGP